MRVVLSFLLALVFTSVLGQRRTAPTNLPSPNSAAYSKVGWYRSDSAVLLGIRNDTNWTPITPALIPYKVGGADTSFLTFWDGKKWVIMAAAAAGGGSYVTSLGYRPGDYVDTFFYTNNNGSIDWYYSPIVSGLLSGGDVLRIGTSLNYSVALAVYRIGRTIYISPADTVTIAARDSLPRIDVFYADTNSLVGVLTGVPDSFPLKPSIDVASQVELGFVYVPAIGDTTGDLNVPNFVLFGIGNKINGEYQFAYDSSTNTVILTGNQERFELNGDQWYHADAAGNLKTAFLRRAGWKLTEAEEVWRWGQLTIRPSLRGGDYGVVVFADDELFKNGIGFPALKHVAIYTDEVERLTVDSVGKVYIKTQPSDTTDIPVLGRDPVTGELKTVELVSNIDTCDAITQIDVITKVSTTPYVCYNVPDVYFAINCNQYFAAADSVCIQPPSPDSLGRFDVIYADTLGNIGVIEGTVDSFPVIPNVDPSYQIFITAIYVALDGGDTTSILQVPNNVLYGKNNLGQIFGDPPFNYSDSLNQVGIGAYPYSAFVINNSNTGVRLKVGGSSWHNGNLVVSGNGNGIRWESFGWQRRQLFNTDNARTISLTGDLGSGAVMNSGDNLNFFGVYDSSSTRPLVFTNPTLNQYITSFNSPRRAVLLPRITTSRLNNMRYLYRQATGDFNNNGYKLQEGMIAFNSDTKKLGYSRDTGWVYLDGDGQNFANADLTATGNREHNFGQYDFAIYNDNTDVNHEYYHTTSGIQDYLELKSNSQYNLQAQSYFYDTTMFGYGWGVNALTPASRSVGVNFIYRNSLSDFSIHSDSIRILAGISPLNTKYNPTTASTTKYKVVLMDSTTGALVTTAPGNIGGVGTVTSVGLSMPSAFTVTNSPVITSGTLTVTGAGTTAQYIRGDGTLATFPSVVTSDSLAFRRNGWTQRVNIIGFNSGYNGSIGSSAAATAVDSANIFGGVRAGLNSTSGYRNLGLGRATLQNNTTGHTNIALGDSAMALGVVTGSGNVAIGQASLNAATSTSNNVAIGTNALRNQTSNSAVASVAIGLSALAANVTGNGLTAVGYLALQSSTGSGNTAVGWQSGAFITSGSDNTHVGYSDGNSTGNTSRTTIVGIQNTGTPYARTNDVTAIGANAARRNTGDRVTVVGSSASDNGTGTLDADNLTAIGYEAGRYLSDDFGVYVGDQAGYDGTRTHTTSVTGIGNIGIGYRSMGARTSGDYNMAFGHAASLPSATASNQITFYAGGSYNVLTRFSGGGWLMNNTGAAVTTQTASTALEVNGTDGGVLMPRLTTTQRDALTPSTGLTVFNTTEGYYEYYDAFWGWMPVYASNEWRNKWGLELHEDFIYAAGVALQWVGTFGSGTGSAANAGDVLGTTSRPGIVTLATGTTTTGLAGVRTSFNFGSLRIGQGQTVFTALLRVPTLSDATNRFHLRFGLGDVNSSATAITNGCFIVYDEGGVSTGSTASANWQAVSASSSSRTWTNSSTSVAAGTWYVLQIEMNAAGTSIVYKVNGTTIATHTTNINTTPGLQFVVQIMKTAGTTSRTTDVDYVSLKQKFTTAR